MELAHDQPRKADAKHHQSREQKLESRISVYTLTYLQSFNVVTQHDSHVMKSDSKSVKAIAIVTMAFLPLATIAVRNLSFHIS